MFIRSGEYWTVGYGNASFAVRDLKGLGYIQRLLQHPGEDFSALDLIRMDGAPSEDRSAEIGSLLDDPAVSISAASAIPASCWIPRQFGITSRGFPN